MRLMGGQHAALLRGGVRAGSYGCRVGMEDWALIALVVVLAVYLLPYLVGRREVMALSRAEDRYSSELRILATGGDTLPDEACTRSGHALIFRQRPEVKAMNRPAVRNVRALRTERELALARRAHQDARASRRTAASHRLLLVSVLLGVTLGALVLGLASPLPVWIAAIPGALFAVSLVAGRRAGLASARAESRERRRISSLEHELDRLSGGTGHVRLSVGATARPTVTTAGAASAMGAAGEASTEAARAGGASSGSSSSQSAAVREDGARRDGATGARTTAEQAHASAGGATRYASAPAATQVADDVWDATGEAQALTGAARSSAADAALAGADVPVQSPRSSERASAEGASASSAPSAASSDLASAPEAKAPTTPPQGWHPVHVPAPSYTLAARAPRRSVPELEEQASESAPVPARPTGVRTFSTAGVEDEEQVFHPIDLDAVLERRRAAGA